MVLTRDKSTRRDGAPISGHTNKKRSAITKPPTGNSHPETQQLGCSNCSFSIKGCRTCRKKSRTQLNSIGNDVAPKKRKTLPPTTAALPKLRVELGCSRCRWSRNGCSTCRSKLLKKQLDTTAHRPTANPAINTEHSNGVLHTDDNVIVSDAKNPSHTTSTWNIPAYRGVCNTHITQDILVHGDDELLAILPTQPQYDVIHSKEPPNNSVRLDNDGADCIADAHTHTTVIAMDQAANTTTSIDTGDLYHQLGCSKCDWSLHGCPRCRDPKFQEGLREAAIAMARSNRKNDTQKNTGIAAINTMESGGTAVHAKKSTATATTVMDTASPLVKKGNDDVSRTDPITVTGRTGQRQPGLLFAQSQTQAHSEHGRVSSLSRRDILTDKTRITPPTESSRRTTTETAAIGSPCYSSPPPTQVQHPVGLRQGSILRPPSALAATSLLRTRARRPSIWDTEVVGLDPGDAAAVTPAPMRRGGSLPYHYSSSSGGGGHSGGNKRSGSGSQPLKVMTRRRSTGGPHGVPGDTNPPSHGSVPDDINGRNEQLALPLAVIEKDQQQNGDDARATARHMDTATTAAVIPPPPPPPAAAAATTIDAANAIDSNRTPKSNSKEERVSPGIKTFSRKRRDGNGGSGHQDNAITVEKKARNTVERENVPPGINNTSNDQDQSGEDKRNGNERRLSFSRADAACTPKNAACRCGGDGRERAMRALKTPSTAFAGLALTDTPAAVRAAVDGKNKAPINTQQDKDQLQSNILETSQGPTTRRRSSALRSTTIRGKKSSASRRTTTSMTDELRTIIKRGGVIAQTPSPVSCCCDDDNDDDARRDGGGDSMAEPPPTQPQGSQASEQQAGEIFEDRDDFYEMPGHEYDCNNALEITNCIANAVDESITANFAARMNNAAVLHNANKGTASGIVPGIGRDILSLSPAEEYIPSASQSAIDWMFTALSDPRSKEAQHAMLRPSVQRIADFVTLNIESTIESGHNNSILLVGSSGSGKTLAMESSLSTIQSTWNTDSQDALVGIVRLVGWAHAEERIAFKEIARQLCEQFQLTFSRTASLGDNIQFLRSMLSALARAHKVAIFLLEDLDLFAKKSKQTLLYCLLDALQTSGMRAVVLGTTCRYDCMDLMEKRVKSRFSHRTAVIVPPRTAITQSPSEDDPEGCEGALDALTAMLTLPDDFPHRAFASKHNAAVHAVLSESSAISALDSFVEIRSGLHDLANVARTMMTAALAHSNGLLKHGAVSAACKALSSGVDPGIEYTIAGLSILELMVLVAAHKAAARVDGNAINFEMMHREFRAYSTSGDHVDNYTKNAACKAFERITAQGLLSAANQRDAIKGAVLGSGQFVPVYVQVTEEELRKGIELHHMCPSRLRDWSLREGGPSTAVVAVGMV